MPLTTDQKTQLVALYDEAQQAGDEAAMARVRDALAADRQETFMAKPPLERIKEHAGKAVQGFVPGVARAPLSFAEGAGSLALDVGQLFAGQRAPRLLPMLQEQEERFDEAVEASRADYEREHPGSVAVSDVAAGAIPVGGSATRVTRAAPEIAKALGAGRFSSGIFRSGAQAAGEGAVLANLPYDPNDDRSVRTFLGAALPGTVRLVSSVGPSGIMNFYARAAARRNDKQVQQLRAEAVEAFTSPVTGRQLEGMDDYTIAQASGDPRVAQMAGRTADTIARDTIRAQLDRRIANIRQVARDMGRGQGSMSSTERQKALYVIVDQTDRDMAKAATSRYSQGIEELAASPEGKAVRVDLAPVRQAMEEIQREYGNIFDIVNKVPTGTNLGKSLRTLEALPDGARLNVRGLESLVKGINTGRTYGKAVVMDANERALESIRVRLQGAVRQAVEAGPNTPGFNRLRGIQEEYAIDMARRRDFKEGVLNDLFGEQAVKDPDALFDAFLRTSPEGQRNAVALLNHRGPEHLAYFRQKWVDQMLDQATNSAKAAASSKLDVDVLARLVDDPKLQDSPLFTPQEKKWFKANVADLRVIMQHNPDPNRPALVLSDIPEQGLMSAISRAPEFMTRTLMRALTGLRAEKLLFTKEGRNALSTVRNLRSAGRTATDRSMAYLVGLLAEEEADTQPPEEEVERP